MAHDICHNDSNAEIHWKGNTGKCAGMFFLLLWSSNSVTFGNHNLPLKAFHWSTTEPLVTSPKCQRFQKRAATTLDRKLNTITSKSISEAFHAYLAHSARWSLEFNPSPSIVAFLQHAVSHLDGILHPTTDLHLDSIWGHQSHPDKC